MKKRAKAATAGWDLSEAPFNVGWQGVSCDVPRADVAALLEICAHVRDGAEQDAALVMRMGSKLAATMAALERRAKERAAEEQRDKAFDELEPLYDPLEQVVREAARPIAERLVDAKVVSAVRRTCDAIIRRALTFAIRGDDRFILGAFGRPNRICLADGRWEEWYPPSRGDVAWIIDAATNFVNQTDFLDPLVWDEMQLSKKLREQVQSVLTQKGKKR